jgi:hypothetical protein
VDVLDRVRDGCAAVATTATRVHIDDDRLAQYVREYEIEPREQPQEPAHEPLGDDESTAALVVQLDALNFGSGWHPAMTKRPGLSGARSVEACWRERAEREGVPTAAELTELTPGACADILGQDPDGPVGELMALFATSLNDLGRFVGDRAGGHFLGLVASAGRSAAALVEILCEMPLYRDEVTHGGRPVPFLKRAQITAADLALAFHGDGPGAFDDLDRLTMFADNLVPHVLRVDGVLRYDDELAAAIDAGRLLAYGSTEEVEIRACAVHALERLSAMVRDEGGTHTPREIDQILWRRGSAPAYKAVPRHRCRTTAY